MRNRIVRRVCDFYKAGGFSDRFVSFFALYGQLLGYGFFQLFLVRCIHAGRHGIVKVGYGLPAVHFVLIRLNRNTGKGRIAENTFRFFQIAVPGGKSVFKQFGQIDLTAGFCQHVKVFVVNMNIAVGVCLCHVFGQNIAVYKMLGTFGSVFEHGTHGGVCVDICVFAFQIRLFDFRKCNFLVQLHKLVLLLPDAGPFGTIQNIRFGGCGITLGNQRLFYYVLHLFHTRKRIRRQGAQHGFCGQIGCRGRHFVAGGSRRFGNGVSDFVRVKRHERSVSF